jgi:hypothetical protein
MADQNLTIGIRADSSQLRADLALAQAQVAAFGQQLRAAAKEALTTGDTSGLTSIAAQYQGAAANAARLGGELKALANAHKELVSPMAAAGGALSAVRTSFSELGASIGNLTSNIFPSFRTIAALSIGAAAVEFVHLADSAASSVRETENLAKAFGLTTEAWEATKLVFAQAGVESERATTGMGRLFRAFGQAEEEQRKLTGAMGAGASGVTVLRGGVDAVANSVETFRGSLGHLATAVSAATSAHNTGAAAATALGKAHTDAATAVGAATGAHHAGAAAVGTATRAHHAAAAAVTELGKAHTGAAAGVKNLSAGVEKLKSDVEFSVQVMRGGAGNILDFSSPLKSLQSMGIEMHKFAALDPEAKIAVFAKGFEAIKSSTDRAVVGMQFFGRGWTQIIAGLHDFSPAIAKASADIVASGLGMTEAEKTNAKIFNIVYERMTIFAQRAKEILGGGIGQALLPVYAEIERQLTTNSAAIRKWADETGQYLKLVAVDFINLFKGGPGPQTDFAKNFVLAKDAIVGAIVIIKGAFTGLMGVFHAVAAGINSIFGTKISGEALAIVAVIGTLSGAFTVLLAAVGLVVTIVGGLITVLGGPITVAVAALGVVVFAAIKNWDNITAAAQAFWDMLVALGSYIGDTFVGLWNSATEAIKNAWTSVTDWISGKIDALLAVLQSLIDKATAIASAVKSAFSASTGGEGVSTAGLGGFARGGVIRGPGTGTSDSILARVSDGEYIVRASAASANRGLLDAINSGFNAPRYALGGLVDALSNIMPSSPGFAAGGLVTAGAGGGSGGGGAVHLHFGNETIAIPTDAQTLAQVARAARQAQTLSAGKKPGWNGG